MQGGECEVRHTDIEHAHEETEHARAREVSYQASTTARVKAASVETALLAELVNTGSARSVADRGPDTMCQFSGKNIDWMIECKKPCGISSGKKYG
eukprot:3010794-Rhodomonas_salina.2